MDIKAVRILLSVKYFSKMKRIRGDEVNKLIIFGLSDLADVAWYYFMNDSNYEVVAFTVEKKYKEKTVFHGLPVVDFEEVEKIYPTNEYEMFIAIGFSNLNQVRTEKYFQAKDKGYTLASFISSHARCNNNSIGDNSFILENVIVQPFAMIGSDVFIWSGSHIGHHASIGDHCFITSHCVISGNVTIEDSCFIGVNATIRDGTHVGRKSILGAGVLLLENAPAQSVYGAKGTPRAPFESWRVSKI